MTWTSVDPAGLHPFAEGANPCVAGDPETCTGPVCYHCSGQLVSPWTENGDAHLGHDYDPGLGYRHAPWNEISADYLLDVPGISNDVSNRFPLKVT